MKIAYIIEENKYYLVRSLEDLDYSKLSYDFKDLYNKEDISKYIIWWDVTDNTNSRLRFDKEFWYWDLFDVPRLPSRGEFMNETVVYNDVKIVDTIQLISILKG